jgi:hypothetical protein
MHHSKSRRKGQEIAIADMMFEEGANRSASQHRPTIFSDYVPSKQSENLQNDMELPHSRIQRGVLFLACRGRHFKTLKRLQSLNKTGIASLDDLTHLVNFCHGVDRLSRHIRTGSTSLGTRCYALH